MSNEYYAPVVINKTLYVSHGEKHPRLKMDSNRMMLVDKQSEFQGQYEKVNALMAFHVCRICGRVVLRSSNIDSIIILIAIAAKMPETSRIVMNFGSRNNRRLINVTNISKDLE